MKAKTAKLFALLLPLAAANVALADEAAMQAAGAEVFKKCAACHSVDTSKNAFGPSLVGVVGREAGSLPRFAYSDALKNSKIIWNEDNLRKWMAGNDQFVPGTRMRHIEITDVAEQDYLLAYLKSLK
ncbi:c-type cytochrome [Neptuniibacter sp. CAU 1671]|uniref:c-type cytochrome n=1 Tax=Neptuniibacter sp. CAU 1671 TaxID=3032593 RepID=UPI0023DBD642|nr:c-type cytochrome [Neptuniibacter sp. CAU 1671]MDF2182147.1 c-type cytochrome [Neptuniibacter sp. CAU 1671]